MLLDINRDQAREKIEIISTLPVPATEDYSGFKEFDINIKIMDLKDAMLFSEADSGAYHEEDWF